MTGPPAPSRFESEASWPFSLRTDELDRCLSFLGAGGTPRVLRIFGSSGAGKSFLVRELMVHAPSGGDEAVGLYIDVPASDLEAAALFEGLDALLSTRREATRDAPSSVGRKAARAWVSAKRGRSGRRVSYGYQVSRDLIAQIPVVGPFIKAVLPQTAPVRAAAADAAAPVRFLTRRSRSRPVFLAIDNVQFLPFAVREMLDQELTEAGPKLRLVLVERVRGRTRLDWMPPVPDAEQLDVELGTASLGEVTELVREVLPTTKDIEDVASTIHRRSEGNLKSVWFQLRLIASRREDQEAVPTSYEDVILTLSPLDQAVLRFVVFTIGGLTIANLVSLLHATDLQLAPDVVTTAIGDLAALGLLVVNGDSANRVRVDHELVAQVVSEITPEEEKLELRAQAVSALAAVLEAGASPADEPVLYDRLLGTVTDIELRRSPSLLSHVVQFVQQQSELERHGYLASICRDSVCWDVLESLPETTIRSLLDAIQKSALFSFGLVATARLRQEADRHTSIASLYEAKYLVQLFRYEEAAAALARVSESKEKRAVAFNIMLNLAQDERAAELALGVYAELSEAGDSEHDFLILRNSAHLFAVEDARTLVEASLRGFEALGREFGVATSLNNLGIVELAAGSAAAAREHFERARRRLAELQSSEVYEPLVNLSAVSLIEGDVAGAEALLAAARDAAPRSLLQDSAMLSLNALTLELIARDRSESDIVERVHSIAAAARRTRDLRFVDVATWFSHALEAAVRGGDGPPAEAQRRMERLRTNGRVPIEIFVTAEAGGITIEAPFVLSPHWRY